jgi:cytidine deaminase
MSLAGPELVFGLVGACGTDLSDVGDRLAMNLGRVDYAVQRVRLSDLLQRCHSFKGLKPSEGQRWPEDERLAALMTAGDDFRRVARRGDAVALLALSAIAAARADASKAGPDEVAPPTERTARIVHSLKHPNELDTLRSIYGTAFFPIAVYLPKTERVKRLAKRIRESREIFNPKGWEEQALSLIERDEKEDGNPFGQSVRDVFHECDVFFDATDENALADQVARFVHILFGHPFKTPTREEYGLFHAKAAALRSADLSRQVGAVIANGDGDILVSGCNEVPKPGGGAVWEGDDADGIHDLRDFRLGYDSSARMKREILEEIIQRQKEAGWLVPSFGDKEVKALFDEALFSRDSAILKGTRAASIIEFGRMVHAEMSALTSAARLGIAVKDATLYCTTFPCHMCARHIVAAGLKSVVYVEPYPKSMAEELYEGAIDVDHRGTTDPKVVRFRPFVGIAPTRYIEFFTMDKRKDERGQALRWIPAGAMPRVQLSPTFVDTEVTHVTALRKAKFSWGIEEMPHLSATEE